MSTSPSISVVPFQSSLPAALLAAGVGVVALLGTGCSHGQARNPSFTAALAPDPTIVVAPIVCLDNDKPGKPALDVEFQRVARASIGVEPVTATAEQQQALCSIVLEDKRRESMPYSQRLLASSGSEWSGSPAVAAVVRDIAKAHDAKSVFVTMSLGYQVCAEMTYQVDSKGNTVIRDSDAAPGPRRLVNEERCGADFGARMRGVLFASDGTIDWKSSFTGRIDTADGMNRGVANILTGLPARLSSAPAAAASPAADASGAANPTPTCDASAPGSSGFDADAIVAKQLGSDAPMECRRLAKSVCESVASMPAESRTATCTRYATSMQALSKTPNGASICGTQLAARAGR